MLPSAEALASGFIALTGDLKAGVDAFRAKTEADVYAVMRMLVEMTVERPRLPKDRA